MKLKSTCTFESIKIWQQVNIHSLEKIYRLIVEHDCDAYSKFLTLSSNPNLSFSLTLVAVASDLFPSKSVSVGLFKLTWDGL